MNLLINQFVVVLCNLRSSKIRGVLSEAMIMCAKSNQNVEILVPPVGSVPGDLIHVKGYNRSPIRTLKKYKLIEPDLKTDEYRQATYKGIPWTIHGKGIVTAPTFKNANIF